MRAVIHIFLSPVLEIKWNNPSPLLYWAAGQRYINCSVTALYNIGAMSENIY